MLTPELGFASVVVVWLLTGTFLLRFRRRKWKATYTGVTIMQLVGALFVVTTETLAFRFVLMGPDWAELRAWIYIVSFMIVALPVWRLHRDLSNVPKKEEEEDAPKP